MTLNDVAWIRAFRHSWGRVQWKMVTIIILTGS